MKNIKDTIMNTISDNVWVTGRFLIYEFKAEYQLFGFRTNDPILPPGIHVLDIKMKYNEFPLY